MNAKEMAIYWRTLARKYHGYGFNIVPLSGDKRPVIVGVGKTGGVPGNMERRLRRAGFAAIARTAIAATGGRFLQGNEYATSLAAGAVKGDTDLVLAPALDVFDPQDKRVDLVLRQHEGRKVVSALQDVSDPRFARDGHARRDQVCNISIDSPLRDLELGRNGFRSDRTPFSPKDLDNDIQSIRPSHQHPHGSLLTPCCQQAVGIKWAL